MYIGLIMSLPGAETNIKLVWTRERSRRAVGSYPFLVVKELLDIVLEGLPGSGVRS
jgi:hypothetical protein